MIWKIEIIEDIDYRLSLKIFQNIRAMLASIEPHRRVSQEKLYKITKLIDRSEMLQQQGLYLRARGILSKAYQELDALNYKRYSSASKFQNFTERQRSWAENYLKKSYQEIRRKIRG